MLSEFLSELRRRRVVRVLIVYAVVAWVVIQVAATTFPVLGLPAWTTKLVVILTILGFPIVIALAWAFDITPQGMERTGPAPEGRRIPRSMRIAAAGVIVAIAGAAAWFAAARYTDAETLDPSLVVVFPFRVSGTDATLREMGEGMVDLLSIKLQGDGGPRAADPPTVIGAWRRAGGESGELGEDDLLAIARRLGGGRMLTGELVSAGRKVVINATLTPVRGGRPVNADVEGPADSLTTLVEQLTRVLLSRDAGEREDRLAMLTTASLPALKHYLHGQAQYRRSHYSAARDAYLAALEADSTFALAGIGVELVAGWTGGASTGAQRRFARRAAWSGRDRLSPVDRTIVHALLGRNYPMLPTEAEKCRNWGAAQALAPQRSEVLHWVADCVYHHGLAFGTPDHLQRARGLFELAFAADSSFMPNLEHLIEIAVVQRDTARLRDLFAFYIANDSTAEKRFPYEWFQAYLSGDSARLRALEPKFATERHAPLITQYHRENNTGVDWAEAVLSARPLPKTPAALQNAREYRFYFALLRGQPEKAADIAWQVAADGSHAGWRWIIQGGLYSEVDSLHMHKAARELERALPATTPTTPPERARYYYDTCMLTQYRLWRGDTRDAQRVISVLAAASDSIGDLPSDVSFGRHCAQLLRAVHAYATRSPDVRQHALRVDSMVAEWPGPGSLVHNARHTAARLLEATGDHAAALRALQRREFMFNQERFQEIRYRESGRLAERTGDVERARREYQAYLDIRSNEDATGRAASQPIRDALERLSAESARRGRN